MLGRLLAACRRSYRQKMQNPLQFCVAALMGVMAVLLGVLQIVRGSTGIGVTTFALGIVLLIICGLYLVALIRSARSR